MKEQFASLEELAKQSLRACYHQGKVVASPTHFSDYWARDSFFAVPGMLGVGDHEQVREVLSYFLDLQRDDGKIPRKVSLDLNGFKYLFGRSIKRSRPYPVYHGLVRPFYAMDSEILLLSGAHEYLRHTRDYAFAEKNYLKLKKAIHWQIDRMHNRGRTLIHEKFLGNWMDTIFKFGPTLYTNILYVKALESIVYIAQMAGRDDEAERYVALAMRSKRAIRDRFWNGKFFCDSELDGEDGVFDLAGNMLAITCGVASSQQKSMIVDYLAELYVQRGAFMPAQYHPSGKVQAWWRINPVVRIMGISDYHQDTCWLWTLTLVVQVLHDNERQDTALDILREIEKVVLRDGKVGETYNRDGSEYVKLLWRSATPFAWSSGMLLETLYANGHRLQHTHEKPDFRCC